MDKTDCVVIGAGVVGLAVARALARAGRETVILEKETQIGSGISARNSEVIHAGIYYPKDSLKARLCVTGRTRLYDYCSAHGIAHARCGKLIVAASDSQTADLAGIKRAAEANGVDDLAWIDGGEARRLEPQLSAVAALLSPSTGIIDSHGYMLSLLGEAEDDGAVIAVGTTVSRAAVDRGRVILWTNGEAEPALNARLVINAAGLFAAGVASRIDGFPKDHVPQAWFAKGNYFTLAGRSPFSRLVYPVPEPGGLGVHLTIDLAGQARFGPDVEWLQGDDPSSLTYDVAPHRADRFYAAIRAYWPALRDGDLAPGYSGIRPKLSGPGQPAADFLISHPQTHGVPGIVNLFGIESPGLTASLAIADEVARLAEETGI